MVRMAVSAPRGSLMPLSSASSALEVRHLQAWGAALALCVTLAAAPAPAFGQRITGDEVRVSMDAARRWLQNTQRPDGSWDNYTGNSFTGATTALATLALLNAGVPPDRDWIQRAIETVRSIPLQETYTVSLKIQALAAASPDRYRDEVQAAADWLTRTQLASGAWTYGPARRGDGDFSNSQFALLGLHEAGKAGAQVPQDLWKKAEQVWVRAQQPDGGWAYSPHTRLEIKVKPGRRGGKVRRQTPRSASYGSMTAAGVASLYITGNSLVMRKGPRLTGDGEPVCCGQYSEYRPIAHGLAWLGENFSAQRNPGKGGWYFYYMYGMERVGILSGLRYLGQHDWYREGAARLVALQRADGSFKETHPVVDTAFALLFLAKGHRPVLFGKLKWSDDDRWNLARNDVAHLVAFIGDRLGEPVSWEATPLDAPVEEWLTAPILYFNGALFPPFDEPAREKLREYVHEGGTILAVGTCKPGQFRQGFVQFARRAFPEFPLVRLPPDHPVFRSVFTLDGAAIELHGLSAGCRTSVFFSPHDIACLWELADIPERSRDAFELGTNIAAYATGLEPLPDKLDVVRVTRRSDPEPEARTPPRGAVFLAQLIHSGDWRPNPRAIPNLADYLHTQMGVDVVPDYEPLRATDPELAQHPIVYMTGHFSFELPPAEVSALRKHLEGGGFLFANACCGRQAFDKSFRELARALFPEHPLERLQPDHPIIAGQPGVPLPEVTYRPSMQAEDPDLKEVRLEGIVLDDRTVVVYSPFSIDCGLDGHRCFACRGLAPEDARRVAGNVILYALSY